MHVISVGINHVSAPIEVRERAAVAGEHLEAALVDIGKIKQIEETTILSTCNRTEIYCQSQQSDDSILRDWLCEFHRLKPAELSPYIYSLPNHQAVRHVFRVAAGLDSMVLGEPQILGQVKTAFAKAHRNGNTGKILNRLFQQSFSVAKKVRSQTVIGSLAVSVAYAAASLAKKIFTRIEEQTVLLIGAGETIELASRHLYAQGARKFIVANRTLQTAQEVAAPLEGQAISLHELGARLADADIIISSTASTLPILGKGAIESAMKKRKNRSLFIVDLAVPRDVEPQVNDVSNVYLYSIDDLNQVVDDNLQSRQAAALEAEKIVSEETQDFMRWFSHLHNVPTIRHIREKTQQISNQELDKARSRLRAGVPAEEVLDQLAHSLTRKFTHYPSATLRDTQDEATLLAARLLFALKDPD